jgi:hypothetical protein
MKRHDRKRKYGRGEVSLVDQGTIDYVSTAYFDQEKFKSIYYIKELFSANASIFKKKIQTQKHLLVTFVIKPRTFSGVGRSKSDNTNPKIF